MRGTKIDMHTHTKGSDGIGTPREIAAFAKLAGLDGICITDHHRTYTPQSLEVAAECRKQGLLIFHGCEYSTEQGHLLIYGVDVADLNPGRYPRMQDLIDAVVAAGGACIPAHPYKGYTKNLGDDVMKLKRVRAYETANGQLTYQCPFTNTKAASAANKAGKLTMGGSDAHNPRDIGLTYTLFEDDIATPKDFITALRRGFFKSQLNRKRIAEEVARRHGSLDSKSRNVHLGANARGKDASTNAGGGDLTSWDWDHLTGGRNTSRRDDLY